MLPSRSINKRQLVVICLCFCMIRLEAAFTLGVDAQTAAYVFMFWWEKVIPTDAKASSTATFRPLATEQSTHLGEW